jgi:hypothetical protein
LPTKLTVASVMTLPSWDCLAGRSALPLDPGDGGCRGMLKDRQGQAVEPTNSARSGSGLPAVGRLGCRLGWSERLRLVVGHARTVRPDPSTLDAVGEQGSHREGRLAACFKLVHQVASALRVYGLPTGSCDVAQRVNRPLGLPCLLYLVVERVSMAELRGEGAPRRPYQ